MLSIYLPLGIVTLTATALTAIISNNPQIYLAVLAGSLIGIVPFASWHLAIKTTNFFQTKKKIKLVAVLMILKYILIAGAIYLLLAFKLVNPLAFVIGLSISPFAILIFSAAGFKVSYP